MIFAPILAAIAIGTNSVTFTATATGVEPRTAIEFFLAGKTSDRDYETVFLIDDSVDALAKAIERAGIPRGCPIDVANCQLWPIGCEVKLSPPISDFVKSEPIQEGGGYASLRYTGGTRTTNGTCEADAEMPQAVMAFYDCPQSLFQFGGIYPQGVVYGRHTACAKLKKGEQRRFTVSWDGTTRVRHLDLLLKPDNAKATIETIRQAAEREEVEVTVGFDDKLTVGEAEAFAHALSVIDSIRVKVNGRRRGDFFYRAFLPLVKWRDRKERLTQPFEVTPLKPDGEKVLFIDEDWSGEGTDPKLTEKPITVETMKDYPKTDTCFFYVEKSSTLDKLHALLRRLPSTVINTYVYGY